MKTKNIEGNELDLIQKLKAKEPGAFKRVVESYQDRIINICYRFVFNKEDAEDLAQEVFIEVHRSISNFREDSKLSTWIYRIAVTKSIDFIRKLKRKKRFNPLKNQVRMDGEKTTDIPAPKNVNPEEILTQEEQKRILKQAIDNLPKNQCIVFTLSKYKGLSNKEICQVMNLSLSAVESLNHRAKATLRKTLYEYFKRDLVKKKKLYFFIMFIMIIYALSLSAVISSNRLIKLNYFNEMIKNRKNLQDISNFSVLKNRKYFQLGIIGILYLNEEELRFKNG